MTARRRAPRPVALAVDRLACTVAPTTPLARIQAAWPQAVGDVVAANATPLRERAGVLTVYCVQSVWAQEVTLMAGDIAARVNGVLGGDVVREIRTTSTPR